MVIFDNLVKRGSEVTLLHVLVQVTKLNLSKFAGI